MRVRIITPAPARSRRGNRRTALRWARILEDLGHSVSVETDYRGERCDMLIALHARRSARAVELFRRRFPASPLIVAMTGTDLYGDLARSGRALHSLQVATRIVVLQPRGIAALPAKFRSKARAIHQSAERPRHAPRPLASVFEVCVLGHLRAVKDPLRAAAAARRLPTSSRIRIVHLGAALSGGMEARARAEMARNPRYRWLGEAPRGKALRILARSRLLVLTSKMEGGANVVSEALAASVPVISSKIEGSIGILGPGYPGYFPVGDTKVLASLLLRAERSPNFYRRLRAWCRRLAPLVDPARERRVWRRLLSELAAGRSPGKAGGSWNTERRASA